MVARRVTTRVLAIILIYYREEYCDQWTILFVSESVGNRRPVISSQTNDTQANSCSDSESRASSECTNNIS